ncbi:MAG: phosphoribosyltransferase family protein [Planctomycetota bacterium]|jgi:putative phosphoribosyl transferase
MRLFKNRLEAAQELSGALAFLKPQDPLILGVPNDGVPIAAAIAEQLEAPLDILLIAKLTSQQVPGQVVGAVDEQGRISMVQAAARWHQLSAKEMIGPAREAFAELQQRRARFRAVLPETDVRGRSVIVVDHGVETGATMLAAIASLRDRGADKVIVAAPAGSGKATWQLHETADTVVIPHTPSRFKGVSQFYEDFSEVTDREVEEILQKWAQEQPEQRPGIHTFVMRVVSEQERVIHCEMDLPPGTTRGSGPYPAVIFAHALETDGRNRRTLQISQRLAKRGIIGVRPDFTGHGRSDGTISDATPHRMLADLEAVLENVSILDEVDSARIGLRGSGTGGLIALQLAVEQPHIAALVVRGPVPPADMTAAQHVNAPTLIIHAEGDAAAKALDQELAATHEVLVIPESGRVYNDPISVELMVSATVDWLVDHLVVPAPAVPTAATGEGEGEAPVVEGEGEVEGEAPVVEAKPPDTSQAPAN